MQKIINSELRYRRLFESTQDGILILDAKTGMIEDVNPYLIKILGYSREEFIKKRLWEVGAFIDTESSKEAFEALQENEYIRYEDLPLRTKDGRLIQVEFVSNVYQEGEEKVIQCNIRDITEHKHIIAALQENEKIYHDLINQSPDGYFIIEVSGNILIVNEAMCKVLEFSEDEFLSMSIWDIIPKEFLGQYRESLTKILEGKSLKDSAEYEVYGKNGTIHYVEILSAPRYSGGNIIGFQGIARNISDRKRAESALLESEEKLRRLVEHLPTVVYTNTIGDASSTIYVSPQIESLLGYTVDEWLADPKLWSKSLHPDDRQHVLKRVGHTDQINEPFNMEYRMIARDSRVTWVHDQVTLIHDLKGQPIYWQGIMLEITERKQAEETIRQYASELEHRVAERTDKLKQTNIELEYANRAKNEFLATMTHELRTPLNSILGLSESLIEQRRDPLTQHQLLSLQIIESSGRHLLELINDVLNMSKIEAGRLDYYPQVVDVNTLCRASLAFVKEQAIRKSIQLIYETDKADFKIYADPRRLKQILVNLLTNGVKFTSKHGHVSLEVNADAEEDLVQFSVADTGIGIEEDDLKRLFQPFVQVDSDLNRQFEGTGLGLVLVERLTDLHGGSVSVESVPGAGSRFTINIPWGRLLVAQQEATKTSGDLVTDEEFEKLNAPAAKASSRGVVLLAEDNEANILTISEYLKSHGYKVFIAQDGFEAIAKAEETNPNIILMDIQMPVLDGLEAIRRLRADSRFDPMPIVALTALAMPGDRERCLEAGANEYMSKPVSLKGLVKTIELFLQQNK
jgi:PAS domain S-box-containing protein